VSENRVLRGIFGPKEEDAGVWRRLHNEELHNLYTSMYTVFWLGNLKGRDYLEGT